MRCVRIVRSLVLFALFILFATNITLAQCHKIPIQTEAWCDCGAPNMSWNFTLPYPVGCDGDLSAHWTCFISQIEPILCGYVFTQPCYANVPISFMFEGCYESPCTEGKDCPLMDKLKAEGSITTDNKIAQNVLKRKDIFSTKVGNVVTRISFLVNINEKGKLVSSELLPQVTGSNLALFDEAQKVLKDWVFKATGKKYSLPVAILNFPKPAESMIIKNRKK